MLYARVVYGEGPPLKGFDGLVYGKWRYQYISHDVAFLSCLHTERWSHGSVQRLSDCRLLQNTCVVALYWLTNRNAVSTSSASYDVSLTFFTAQISSKVKVGSKASARRTGIGHSKEARESIESM